MIKNIKNDIELSSFHVIFDGSTMNEKNGSFGASHICEHLICKSFEHLQDDFQRYGINWNAFTSNTEVIFYMNGIDEHVNKYKEEFLKNILSYEPTEEELENEKNIVLEEYKDSFNDQISNHFLNLNRKKLNFYNPIGLRNDIENFTIEDCKEYISLYLKKPSYIINVSKYNNFESDVEFKDKIDYEPIHFTDTSVYNIKNENDLNVPEGLVPLELINEYNNKESIINISNIATDDFALISFTCNVLGSGLNSPLYQEVREKSGLAYYIQSVNQKLNNNSSYVVILTEASIDNVKKVQTEIGKVLNNKEKYVTQERFDIVKDNFLVKLKKNDILRHNNVSKYYRHDKWNLESIIDDITLDDVYDCIDTYFNWDNFYKSIYSQEF